MSVQSESTRAEAAPAARAEQVFFEDPAIDRMMGVLMALAVEHYDLHDRVRTLERALIARGVLDADAVEQARAPGPADQADATAFAENLLRPLLGLQLSTGAAGPFSLKRRSS